MARQPLWGKTTFGRRTRGKPFDTSRSVGTRTTNARWKKRGLYFTRDKQGGFPKMGNTVSPIPFSDHNRETLDLDAIFCESQARCLTRIAESTQRMRDRMAEEGPFIKATDLQLEEIRR